MVFSVSVLAEDEGRGGGEGRGGVKVTCCVHTGVTDICMCVLHIGAICTYTVVYNIYRNTCTKWTNQPHVIVHRVTGT